MAYRTISTILTDMQTDAATLSAAAGIAQAREAHLDVYCVGVDTARYDAIPAGSAAIILESGLAEARERADALADAARQMLPEGMVKVAIQPATVPQMGLDSVVARLARYSDLIVATKPYGPGRVPLQVNVLESVLFGTVAPILVVPEGGLVDPAKPFGRVMIAWNESDECFTAIRQALPMLREASRVDVVMVDPPSHSPERSDPGGMVSVMLSRHGVKPEVSILSRTLPRVSEVLARFARENAVDAIVMGAYGHSRFREAILGGATREMLETTKLPLIMAH